MENRAFEYELKLGKAESERYKQNYQTAVDGFFDAILINPYRYEAYVCLADTLITCLSLNLPVVSHMKCPIKLYKEALNIVNNNKMYPECSSDSSCEEHWKSVQSTIHEKLIAWEQEGNDSHPYGTDILGVHHNLVKSKVTHVDYSVAHSSIHGLDKFRSTSSEYYSTEDDLINEHAHVAANMFGLFPVTTRQELTTELKNMMIIQLSTYYMDILDNFDQASLSKKIAIEKLKLMLFGDEVKFDNHDIVAMSDGKLREIINKYANKGLKLPKIITNENDEECNSSNSLKK